MGHVCVVNMPFAACLGGLEIVVADSRAGMFRKYLMISRAREPMYFGIDPIYSARTRARSGSRSAKLRGVESGLQAWRRRRSGAFVLLCLLMSCAEANRTDCSDPEEPEARSTELRSRVIQTGPIRGAIMRDAGRWEPTERDVADFEASWANYLGTLTPPDHELVAYSDRYVRQYVGTVAGNQRAITARFLCNYPPTWTQTSVGFRDGEPCFFRVESVVGSGRVSFRPRLSRMRHPSRIDDGFWGIDVVTVD